MLHVDIKVLLLSGSILLFLSLNQSNRGRERKALDEVSVAAD